MRVILDSDSVMRGLRRIAGEIVERHAGIEDLVLVGIRRGGVAIAKHLADILEKQEDKRPPSGTVDITLYRDDAATALPNPRIGPSEIPGTLKGKHVVLVDDVAYTGRTVRAALDALLDFGRPKSIELAVLIDRPGRELPIQPDYKVRTVEVADTERVDVIGDADGIKAIISPKNAPSTPPPAK